MSAKAAEAPSLTLPEKFDVLESTLNTEVVERKAEIRALMIALVAGVHIFLLGPPGVAKSMLINRLQKYLSGARGFDILMTRFTQPEEVWGPVSLKGLENDEFVRVLDGFLAEAELAFLDEIWKANSSILNSFLWAINERQYRHGNKVIDLPLGTLMCASNELPQDDTLSALYDRLLFRFEVKAVRDQSNFVRMLRTVRPENPQPILTWDEVLQAKKEAAAVVLPDPVYEALAEVRRQLKAKEIEPTPRRFVECTKVIRATAWLDGCDVADVEHLRPLQHILWEVPEQQPEVDKIVLQFANPLDNEATALLEEVDKLEAKVDAIGDDEEKHRKGTEIHGKLRRAKKQLDDIEKRAGNSRRRSETILEVKERLHSLTERVLTEVFQYEESNPEA
jgi:MoxR-like ATPase